MLTYAQKNTIKNIQYNTENSFSIYLISERTICVCDCGLFWPTMHEIFLLIFFSVGALAIVVRKRMGNTHSAKTTLPITLSLY